MTVILLSGDLMVVSRVAGAAAQQGAQFKSAATAEQAIELCRAGEAEQLLVDLSTPELNIAALVASVGTRAVRRPAIIAFGPHVHEERLAAAREAGCERVVSRGQFMSQLEALLQL